MKIRQLMKQTIAGSTTVTGSIFDMQATMSTESTAVVQLSSADGGALADITIRGRLDMSSDSPWWDLTTGASGGIQIVPRCAQYQAYVVNTNVAAKQFTVMVGV